MTALAALGAAVRVARHHLGWSQRDLAARADVNQSVVSRIERGVIPGMALILYAKVARALAAGLPLGGCPHHHGCGFDHALADAIRKVAPDHPMVRRVALESLPLPVAFRAQGGPDTAIVDDAPVDDNPKDPAVLDLLTTMLRSDW